MRGICAAFVLLSAATGASAAIYVPVVPVSGSEITMIRGINGKNEIAGGYRNPHSIVEHAFVGTLDGSYLTFDIGVLFTEPRAINNAGVIVGNADDGQSDGLNIAFQRWPNGKTVTITKDGKPLYDGVTPGLNNLGTFVGWGFEKVDGVALTHVYYGRKGKYVGDLDISLSSPEPHGVNVSNVVVGFFLDAGMHGFILANGIATRIDYPDPKAVNGTELNGINDGGMITGDWLDVHHRPHAFKYDMNTAVFTPLHPPGTPYGQAWGINDKGLIAVTTDDGSFVYCPNAKRCPSGGAAVVDEQPVRLAARRP